jgi:hypothetical protein
MAHTRADVICLGELLIDFVPTVTGTSLIDAPAFKKPPGGARAPGRSTRRTGRQVP